MYPAYFDETYVLWCFVQFQIDRHTCPLKKIPSKKSQHVSAMTSQNGPAHFVILHISEYFWIISKDHSETPAELITYVHVESTGSIPITGYFVI